MHPTNATSDPHSLDRKQGLGIAGARHTTIAVGAHARKQNEFPQSLGVEFNLP